MPQTRHRDPPRHDHPISVLRLRRAHPESNQHARGTQGRVAHGPRSSVGHDGSARSGTRTRLRIDGTCRAS
eukprot:1893343-Pyramimonas_sp.AAC.1